MPSFLFPSPPPLSLPLVGEERWGQGRGMERGGKVFDTSSFTPEESHERSPELLGFISKDAII